MSTLKESRYLAVKKLPEADIYLGDFNMQPDELANNFSFKSSFSFKNYHSFPSKQLTLDYVLLAKGFFESLELISDVSDHNGLFVIINI